MADRSGYAAQYRTPTRPTSRTRSALFNNIFWNNNAFTLDQPGPGATLVDQGFIDFEVHADGNDRRHVHTPLLGSLTNGQILARRTVRAAHACPVGKATSSASTRSS